MGVTGALGHAHEIEAVQARDRHSFRRCVFGVFQNEMHQVLRPHLADGGQAGQVGAQRGVAVQNQDAAVGLRQGEA